MFGLVSKYLKHGICHNALVAHCTCSNRKLLLFAAKKHESRRKYVPRVTYTKPDVHASKACPLVKNKLTKSRRSQINMHLIVHAYVRSLYIRSKTQLAINFLNFITCNFKLRTPPIHGRLLYDQQKN